MKCLLRMMMTRKRMLTIQLMWVADPKQKERLTAMYPTQAMSAALCLLINQQFLQPYLLWFFLFAILELGQCFDWQLMNFNFCVLNVWLVTTCWQIAVWLSCWTHHHQIQLSRSCNSSEGAVVWHMTCRQPTTVHNSIVNKHYCLHTVSTQACI